MGRVTEISWTATPAPMLAGLDRCPGCRAELFVVGGVTYHPGATHNPWWGCQRISEGCQFCYAESFDRRLGGDHWGPEVERRFFGDKHWNEPRRWNAHAAELGIRIKVFCASMADVFERRPDLVEPRARLWRLVMDTPHLDWLLLTKRPENFDMLPWGWPDAPRPWPNVWLGVTAENQRRAEERLPLLLEADAVVRFVSYEPAVGPLDVSPWLYYGMAASRRTNDNSVDWVIAGSESGPGAKARPADLDWYRAMRDQCRAGEAAFLLKQHCRKGVKIPLPALDGRQHFAFPEPHDG